MKPEPQGNQYYAGKDKITPLPLGKGRFITTLFLFCSPFNRNVGFLLKFVQIALEIMGSCVVVLLRLQSRKDRCFAFVLNEP